MTRQLKILWLGGIFGEETVKSFSSISAASNFWQASFVENAIKNDIEVDVVGFPTERVWPFGRCFIFKKNLALPQSINVEGLGYINLPFFRIAHQFIVLMIWIVNYLITKPAKPDYIVVYTCLVKSWIPTAPIWAAKVIRKFTGIPILCVVADGASPKGANRYIYLAWSSYLLTDTVVPKLHLDGGIPEIDNAFSTMNVTKNMDKTVFMYFGALTDHGGINELASAFTILEVQNTELWICGRGDNIELQELSKRDNRIKLIGFLDEDKLYEMASRATFFVNPRPLSFAPNTLNFPSKLLLYLAFGKPIISTISPGMSPKYSSVVIEIEDESEGALIRSLEAAIQMDTDDYSNYCEKVDEFKELHAWDMQISRFLDWLCKT